MGHSHPFLGIVPQPRVLKEMTIEISHFVTEIRVSNQKRNCPRNVLKIRQYLHHRQRRLAPWGSQCRSLILRNHLVKGEGRKGQQMPGFPCSCLRMVPRAQLIPHGRFMGISRQGQGLLNFLRGRASEH